MNAQTLVFAALLHATTHLEATNVDAPLGFLMISSQVHAMMSMSVHPLRTLAVMAAPTPKVVTFVAAHLDIIELDKGEYNASTGLHPIVKL